MTNPEKKYKFFLHPHIYYNKIGSKFLLYNTKNGDCIESDSLECSGLIESVYIPENLGVIDIYESQLEKKEIIDFIRIIKEKGFGKLDETGPDTLPVVNLLPILNLQTDIERLKKNNESLTDNVQNYLNEMNIYINEHCDLGCSDCKLHYKQVRSCYRSDDNRFLALVEIKKILDEASNSLLKKVNLLGGNIYLYPHLKELMALLNEYQFEFHFWVHYKNLIEYTLLNSNIHKDILVTFPIDEVVVLELLDRHRQSKFHFIVETEAQVDEIEQVLQGNFDNYTIMPIFNGRNLQFFKENIYLEKQDIFSTTISQREIFRNQKLNSNFFGKLYVLPDGSVKANMNSAILGNINTNSLLEIIYLELHKNTAWRKVRDEEPCSACLYQFLCPAPSNYEMVISEPNLCNILEDN